MAKKRKNKPHPSTKEDSQRPFAFDPPRREAMKWGFIAGSVGGLLIIQRGIAWQIVGMLVMFGIFNYKLFQLSQRIPRWHALINATIGLVVGTFSILTLGILLHSM